MSGITGVDIYRRNYRQNRRNVRSLATSTTLTVADNGSLLVTTAAITVTLPAVADSAGLEYYIVIGADLAVTIAAPTDTLVAGNDITATSITFSTSTEIAGNGVHVICDGTKWYSFVALAKETFTPTIA